VRILFGEFVLDRETRQLLRGEEEVHLVPKAFELLDMLVDERPKALSKARVRDRLWPRTFVSDSNLTSLVTELRGALGDDARHPRFIRTVSGFGYAFCGAAARTDEPPGNWESSGARPRLLYQGREITLRNGENVLGRADEVVGCIDSPTVSRRHARILVRDGEATLEDLGSRNGTYLRGERVRSPSILVDGDEIRLGRVPIMFRARRPAGSTESEPSGS
jgi:DNA-binding winged helix-turn-helix (wHTH) protein